MKTMCAKVVLIVLIDHSEILLQCKNIMQ